MGDFGAEPHHVQQGSGEGSGESLGGFGAEPGQVQQGFREKVPEKVWESLVQERFVKMTRCGCWGYHRSLLYLGKITIYWGCHHIYTDFSDALWRSQGRVPAV